MTDNTLLNADDELRKHCDRLGVPSLWYDKLVDIVEADRKKNELQARIEEVERELKRYGDVFNYPPQLLMRKAELKTKQEEV